MRPQEKSAWIILIALSVISWSYFSVVWNQSAGLDGLVGPNLPSLIGYTVGFIIFLVVLHVLAGFFLPNDNKEELDEREKLIEVRASHYSGLAMGFIVVAGLFEYAVRSPGDGNILFYTVLASLIISQLLESFLTIFYHRRGI